MVGRDEAVRCPTCGTRNKRTWEFCVQCGGSLEDAAPATANDAAEVLESAPPDRPGAFSWDGTIALASLVGLAVVMVGACKAIRQGVEPVQPQPGILTIATLPASPPPSPAVGQDSRGREAFAEGYRLLAAGDASGAIPHLAQAVAEDPGNAHYNMIYADALWKTNSKDEALARAEEAARLEPARRAEYAAYLDQAGRTTDAAREYERIIEANPGDFDSMATFGRLLNRTGNYARAAAVLQEAAQQRPADPELAANLGMALEKTHDLGGAAQAYSSALSVNPGDAGVRGRLAEVYYQQGDVERAVREYQTGLQTTPGSPDLQRGLGGVLERAGRIPEAVAAYREYARLAPNAPDAADLAVRAGQLERRAGGS